MCAALQVFGEACNRLLAKAGRPARAQHADPFAILRHENADGKHQKLGFFGLGAQIAVALPAEAGCVIAPEQHRARGLQFCFAYEQFRALGRAAPVDPVGRVFLRIAAILPEMLARAGAASARRPDMRGFARFGLEVQAGQLAGKALGLST